MYIIFFNLLFKNMLFMLICLICQFLDMVKVNMIFKVDVLMTGLKVLMKFTADVLSKFLVINFVLYYCMLFSELYFNLYNYLLLIIFFLILEVSVFMFYFLLSYYMIFVYLFFNCYSVSYY